MLKTATQMKSEQDRICSPIKSFEELLSYQTPSWATDLADLKKRSPLAYKNVENDLKSMVGFTEPETYRQQLKSRAELPKTLVCHDMKGGYLEDKYCFGSNRGFQYIFRNWQNIDIFVYFSHEFITIPPPVWINCAHKNGVKILGTIITEGERGKKMCSSIFEDEIKIVQFSQKLVEISQNLKLDGWLLNFENEIKPSYLLSTFVEFLTKNMHEAIKHSEVIWYDSVTVAGDLIYQNELNHFNKSFFNVCDGIFLNYNWTEENLKKSFVEATTKRNYDVYVGVDVFGRSIRNEGKMNSHKSLKTIEQHKLSYAIFAPGWTYECCDANYASDPKQFFNCFLNRDIEFWYSLWPYLNSYPITFEEKLITRFNLGSNEIFYNLSSQDVQLSIPIRKSENGHQYDNLVFKNNWADLGLQNLKYDYCYLLFNFDVDIKVQQDSFVLISTKEKECDYDLRVITSDKSMKIFSFLMLFTEDLVRDSERPQHLKNINESESLRCYRLQNKCLTMEKLLRIYLIPKTNHVYQISFFAFFK